MKYFSGTELYQYESWIERSLAPKLQEAIYGIEHLRNGKFAARVELLKKGLNLIGYLNRAKTAEREIKIYDNRNTTQ